MNFILSFVCKAKRSISNRWYHYIYMPFLLAECKACGKNVVVSSGSRIAGTSNISFGHDVYIGPGAVLYSTRAELSIGNYVNFGPNVTIITGDHRTDVIGDYMKCVPEDEKLPENDQAVVVEDDVWVGTGAIILKGVRIGEGSVIAAGAIVTKDVPPYSIYLGRDRIKERFTSEQIEEHKRLIQEKYFFTR